MAASAFLGSLAKVKFLVTQRRVECVLEAGSFWRIWQGLVRLERGLFAAVRFGDLAFWTRQP